MLQIFFVPLQGNIILDDMADTNKYDFKIDDGSKVFFTSDTHFNHQNIIASCNRPFKDEEEMNEVLIENWNSVVTKDSVIFHLGDFAWGNKSKWIPICKRLNGHIVLILGNHDFKNGPKTGDALDELFDYTTQQMYIRIEGKQLFLNHFPFLCYSGVYREPEDQTWALHGHVHLGPDSLGGLDVPRMKYLFPAQYDVGVDMNNYTPISWKELKEKIEFQIKNNVNCLYWTKNENTNYT